jgi:hypothetical protein
MVSLLKIILESEILFVKMLPIVGLRERSEMTPKIGERLFQDS